jgi:adenylate cyclase
VSRLAGLGEWLAGAAFGVANPAPLHDAFCRELVRRGLPIWRCSLSLETLHPELGGIQFIWRAGEHRISTSLRAGMDSSPEYVNSPIYIVDRTGETFRRRLDRPAPELPLLEELRADGATDYVIFPLPFVDRRRSATISFATTAPAGFSPEDIDELGVAARIFSPYAEKHALRRIGVDLLDTYVGHIAGEKVFDGRLDRGDVERIEAAVWFCDLRGFTAWSDVAPLDEVIVRLNEWFDRLAEPIARHRGEILKFLGDGLLAIFPGETGDACARALAAAREAVAAVAEMTPPPAFGLALHVGEVGFGNVGSRTRLDFTVIGPTVNHAARLEELTKTLHRTVLASGVFAACIGPGSGLVPLGLHRLRDVPEPEEVWTI